MANQPDFGLLTQSYRNITDQIGLIANLPAVNDRQLAQTRHDQLLRAIQGLTTRVDEMDRNFGTRLDGLETRLMIK
jgi:hypothetical protein